MGIESKYLNEFFIFLNLRDVFYCVMNNYLQYPDVIPSDIDIVIERKVFEGLDDLVSQFAAEQSLSVIQKIWHGYQKCAYILSPYRPESRFRLQLDFFVDFTAKGYFCLIPSQVVLASRVQYKNFYVPDPAVELTFLVMRRIIKNDSSIPKHAEMNEISQSTSFSWSKVSNYFDNDLALFVKNFIAATPEEHKLRIAENKNYISDYSKSSTSWSYKAKYYLSQLFRIAFRLFRPVGLSVCFLSPDGAGKSTVARKVIQLTDGAFHGAMSLYWRPRLLPSMGRLKFWNPSIESKENPDPHGHPPQFAVKSLVRFFYYLLDFVFGYIFLVYPAIVRKQLVCFDRYYYDYFVDMHRYRMSLPSWIPKVFSIFVPAPNLVFILSAPPAIMFARKQEILIEELERQHNVYHNLVMRLPNCYLVDTNRPIDDVCNDIVEIILRTKSAQTHRSMFIHQ